MTLGTSLALFKNEQGNTETEKQQFVCCVADENKM